jgi:hypothetical protein
MMATIIGRLDSACIPLTPARRLREQTSPIPLLASSLQALAPAFDLQQTQPQNN